MPTVPVSRETSVRTAPLPGARVNTEQPLSAFGGGQEVQQTTHAAQGLVNDVSGIIAKQKQDADDVRVTGSDLEMSNVFTDIQTSLKRDWLGQNAMGAPDYVEKEWKTRTDKIRQGLSNDQQKAKFDRIKAVKSSDLYRVTQNHVTEQSKKYEDDLSKAYIQNAQGVAALNYMDIGPEGLVEQSVFKQRQELINYGYRNGIPVPVIEGEIAKSASQTYARVIAAMLDNKDGQAASAYLTSKKDKISQEDQKKIEGMFKDSSRDLEYDLNDKFINGNLTIEEIQAASYKPEEGGIGVVKGNKLMKDMAKAQSDNIDRFKEDNEAAEKYVEAVEEVLSGVEAFKAKQILVDSMADNVMSSQESRKINRLTDILTKQKNVRDNSIWTQIPIIKNWNIANESDVRELANALSNYTTYLDEGKKPEEASEAVLRAQYNKTYPQAPLGPDDKVFDPKREREISFEPIQRALKGIARGASGTVESFGSGLEWLGAKEVGKAFEEWGKTAKDFYAVEDSTYLDQVYEGLGSMSTFFIPGLGISKGVQIAKIAPSIARWIGVGTSTILEEIVNSGDTYKKAIENGYGEKSASLSATATFWGNLPQDVVLNRFGVFGDKGPKILQVLTAGTLEGAQEFSQAVVGNIALSDPINWKEATVSASIGMITGSGVKTAETVTQTLDDLGVASEFMDSIKALPGGKERGSVVNPFNSGEEPINIQPSENQKAMFEGKEIKVLNESVEATTEDLVINPDKVKNIIGPAFIQDGKVYGGKFDLEKNANHADIFVRENLDQDKAKPGFLTKNNEFVYQYKEDIPQSTNPADFKTAEEYVAAKAKEYFPVEKIKHKSGVVEADYRGNHTAPTADSGSPLYDLSGTYPDDVYSGKAAQYYGHYGQNHPDDMQTVSIMQQYRNKPDKVITIYRAIPKDSKSTFTAGDWVSINRNYAKEHGESQLNGEYKIISKTVSARDIFTNGDSIHEWGYDPQPYLPAKEKPFHQIEGYRRKAYREKLTAEWEVAQKTNPEAIRTNFLKNQSGHIVIPNIPKIGADGQTAKDFHEWVDAAFVPLSTRLAKISKTLRDSMRKFEYLVRAETSESLKIIEPFLNKYSELNPADAKALDLALKNSDHKVVDEIVSRNGIIEEYEAVRNELNKIYIRARQAGMDVGYLDLYFPRRVIDAEAFMNYLRNGEQWSQIENLIKEEQVRIGELLNNEEKVEFINKLLRGFAKGEIRLSRPSNTKARKIETVDGQMNVFYKNSTTALHEYVSSMNNAIESRKFFGMDGKDVDKSIGKYTHELMEKGLISHKDEAEVKKIMEARFKQRGTRGWVSLWKNTAYIYTMGSPVSALSQINDLASSLFENGIYSSGVGLAKAISGKGVKTSDLHLDRIAEEFVDQSKIGDMVQKLFRVIGFSKMDSLLKETFINGAMNKLSKQANANDPALIQELNRVFGEESAQTLDDLKNENPTENVKYLLFSRLLDYQPVTVSEMPEYYAKGGNMRIAYMLKSYSIKQLDVYHNKIFMEMKNNPKKAMIDLVRFSMALAVMGASTDVIKDLLLGRPIRPSDLVIDNILRLIGFSKYTIYKAKREGLRSAVLSTIAPPFPVIGDLYSDLQSKRGVDNYKVWSGLPLIGKFYYWWFGGGRQYLDNKKKKKRTRLDF